MLCAWLWHVAADAGCLCDKAVFVLCVGPAVTHRMYCMLHGLIVQPHFSFPISSPGALHVRWRERPLSAKSGTIGEKCPINLAYNCDFHGNYRVRLHAANLRHGTLLYFPSEERHAEYFFRPEKSDGFGRVWTRELGYQIKQPCSGTW
jgi:hypothetical protein